MMISSLLTTTMQHQNQSLDEGVEIWYDAQARTFFSNDRSNINVISNASDHHSHIFVSSSLLACVTVVTLILLQFYYFIRNCCYYLIKKRCHGFICLIVVRVIGFCRRDDTVGKVASRQVASSSSPLSLSRFAITIKSFRRSFRWLIGLLLS